MDFSKRIAAQKAQLVEQLQSLVRIDSVEGEPAPGMPFGPGPAKALEKGLSICRDMGFKTVNLDNYIGYAEYGEGEELLAILGHMDVVPVGDGWTMDPFCAEVVGNRLYGRGSYDDKGGVVAAIHALKAVAEEGCRFHRRVRIILGANEETGMNDIPYYLEREGEPDLAFSPDSPFPVAYGEKGVLDFDVLFPLKDGTHLCSMQGGDNRKFTPDSCTVVLRVSEAERAEVHVACAKGGLPFFCDAKDIAPDKIEITTGGRRVFAVRPWEGENAIAHMVEFLQKIPFLADDMGDFCNYYMTKFGYVYDGSNIDCVFKDDISTPISFSADMVQITDGKIVISVHSRFPVTADCDEVVGRIGGAYGVNGATVEFIRVSPAHYMPADSELVSTLIKVYRDVTGEANAQPVTMEGGTYARTLKNAVAFGPLFPGEPQVAHSADEYVNLDSLEKAANIYAQAIYALCCK